MNWVNWIENRQQANEAEAKKTGVLNEVAPWCILEIPPATRANGIAGAANVAFRVTVNAYYVLHDDTDTGGDTGEYLDAKLNLLTLYMLGHLFYSFYIPDTVMFTTDYSTTNQANSAMLEQQQPFSVACLSFEVIGGYIPNVP